MDDFKYFDSKSALLQLVTVNDYIHESWLLPSGKVIYYEYIPYTYPAGSLRVVESIEEYIQKIKDTTWINDYDDIISYKRKELLEHGLTFK